MMSAIIENAPRDLERARSGEQGWALLGLLLALAILAMTLASVAVPNVQMQVQRDKEVEMMYRGQQMAEGIARYYNNGALGGINLTGRPPVYGYLTDLKKLRDGVTIGVREIKFVRASAMIDPMVGEEWEPVRLRDPRLHNILQAYAAHEGVAIPQSYMLLAGPPTKIGRATPLTPEPTTPSPPVPPPPAGAAPGAGPTPPTPPQKVDDGDDDDDDDDDDDEGDDDDDDDGDDDEDVIDPLKSLFQESQDNLPIVGVAPKRKGPSVRAYYGLKNYEEWVFIYLPPPGQQGRPNLPLRPTVPAPQGDKPLR